MHLLVSWGLFRRDGTFLPVEAAPDPETVARLFRHRVLRMLLAEGAIAESVVHSLLACPHTGFRTHGSRAIPVDEQTPGVVAWYMARPPITRERKLGGADTERIIYCSDAVHLRHQAKFRIFEPLDFLAEVSADIPDFPFRHASPRTLDRSSGEVCLRCPFILEGDNQFPLN